MFYLFIRGSYFVRGFRGLGVVMEGGGGVLGFSAFCISFFVNFLR